MTKAKVYVPPHRRTPVGATVGATAVTTAVGVFDEEQRNLLRMYVIRNKKRKARLERISKMLKTQLLKKTPKDEKRRARARTGAPSR